MKTLTFATIVLLGTLGTCAQSISTTTQEAKQKARKLLFETPHRVKMTVEMRETPDSSWELYSSQTREVAGRDRWHLVQHTGSKLESIGIEGRIYQKMPDGNWRVGNAGDGYTGATMRPISTPVVASNTIADPKDGSKGVETTSRTTSQVIRTGEVVDLGSKKKEWFDDAGRLIRAETEHFNFERKKFQRVTEVYEYDPNIRIEPPILD